MTEVMEVQQTAVHLDAVNWFEIPTDDLDRATAFYEMLLGQKLRVEVFGERIAMFPSSVKGVGGCLVQREFQRPSDCGVLVYLNCDSGLDTALDRLKASGQGGLWRKILPAAAASASTRGQSGVWWLNQVICRLA